MSVIFFTLNVVYTYISLSPLLSLSNSQYLLHLPLLHPTPYTPPHISYFSKHLPLKGSLLWKCFPVNIETCLYFIFTCLSTCFLFWIHSAVLFSSFVLLVYLSTCLLFYLSTCILVYLYTCLLVYLSSCLLVYLYTCILAYLSTCLLVYFYTCLLVYLSTCLLVYLSTCLPVNYPFCLQYNLLFV